MSFTDYASSTHFTNSIQRARALDALAEAHRARTLRAGRPSAFRRSVGLTLIHVGLRLIPDAPIRGPSTATGD